MDKSRLNENPRKKQGENERRKKQTDKLRDGDTAAEGGFMLTTSEVLDFSEGTDSTP